LDPSGSTLVWAATVGTDAAGKVYFAWSDSKNVYLDVSSNGGVTWTKPRRLNPPGTAAVYPTVAGGMAGRVDVAWYGTNRSGNSNDSKRMGRPNADGSARWVVDLARSRDAGTSFTIRPVTGVIHRGELCTHGSSCGDTNSRNLLDDFGAAISPTTGLTSVTYTADMPQGNAATAFTGYTTEVAPARHVRTGGSGTDVLRTGATLAKTGAPPLLALAGA